MSAFLDAALAGLHPSRGVQIPITLDGEQEYAANNANAPEFAKGLSRAVSGMESGVRAGVGQLVQPFSNEIGTGMIRDAMGVAQRDAAVNQPAVGTWAEAKQSPDKFISYALGKTGEMIPVLAPMYAGGLLGRAITGTNAGAQVGGAASFLPQMVGHEAMQLEESEAGRQMTPMSRAIHSLGWGGAGTAAMAAVPAAMGGAMLKPHARSLAESVLVRPALHTVGGGAGMAAADLINQVGQTTVDPNAHIDLERTKEAMIGGMIGMAPLAAAHAVPEAFVGKATQAADAVAPHVKRAYDAIPDAPESVKEAAARLGDAAAKTVAHAEAAGENIKKYGKPILDEAVEGAKNDIADAVDASRQFFADVVEHVTGKKPDAETSKPELIKSMLEFLRSNNMAAGEGEGQAGGLAKRYNHPNNADMRKVAAAGVKSLLDSGRVEGSSVEPLRALLDKAMSDEPLTPAEVVQLHTMSRDFLNDEAKIDALNRVLKFQERTGRAAPRKSDEDFSKRGDVANKSVREMFATDQMRDALVNLGVGDRAKAIADDVLGRVQMTKLSKRGLSRMVREEVNASLRKLGLSKRDDLRETLRQGVTEALRPHLDRIPAEFRENGSDLSPEFDDFVRTTISRLVKGNSGITNADNIDTVSNNISSFIKNLVDGKEGYAGRARDFAQKITRLYGKDGATALSDIVEAAQLEVRPDGEMPKTAQLDRLGALSQHSDLITKVASILQPIIDKTETPNGRFGSIGAVPVASELIQRLRVALDSGGAKGSDSSGGYSSRVESIHAVGKKATERIAALEKENANLRERISRTENEEYIGTLEKRIANNESDIVQQKDVVAQAKAAVEAAMMHERTKALDDVFYEWVDKGYLDKGARGEFRKIVDVLMQHDKDTQRLDRPDISDRQGAKARTGSMGEDDADSPDYLQDLAAEGQKSDPSDLEWQAAQIEAHTGSQGRKDVADYLYHGTDKLNGSDSDQLGAPVTDMPSTDFPFGQIEHKTSGLKALVHSDSGLRVSQGKMLSVADWAKDLASHGVGNIAGNLRYARDQLLRYDQQRKEKLQKMLEGSLSPTDRLAVEEDIKWIDSRAELGRNTAGRRDGEFSFFDPQEKLTNKYRYYRTQQHDASNFKIGAEEVEMYGARPGETDAQYAHRVQAREGGNLPIEAYKDAIIHVELENGKTVPVDIARLVAMAYREHQQADIGTTPLQVFNEVIGVLSTGKGIKQVEGQRPYDRFTTSADGKGFFDKDLVIMREGDINKRGLRGDKRVIRYGDLTGNARLGKDGKYETDNIARDAEGKAVRIAAGTLVDKKNPIKNLMPSRIGVDNEPYVGRDMLVTEDGRVGNFNPRALLARMMERYGLDSNEIMSSPHDMPLNLIADLIAEGVRELKTHYGFELNNKNDFSGIAVLDRYYGEKNYPITWKNVTDRIALHEEQAKRGEFKPIPREPDRAMALYTNERVGKVEANLNRYLAEIEERKARIAAGDLTNIKDTTRHADWQNERVSDAQRSLDDIHRAQEREWGGRTETTTDEFGRTRGTEFGRGDSDLVDALTAMNVKDTKGDTLFDTSSHLPYEERSAARSRWLDTLEEARDLNELRERMNSEEFNNALKLMGELKRAREIGKDDAFHERLKEVFPDVAPEGFDVPGMVPAPKLISKKPAAPETPITTRVLKNEQPTQINGPRTVEARKAALAIEPEQKDRVPTARAEPEKLTSGLEKSRLTNTQSDTIIKGDVDTRALANELNSEAYSMPKHSAVMRDLTDAQKVALKKELRAMQRDGKLVDYYAGAKLIDKLPDYVPEPRRAPESIRNPWEYSKRSPTDNPNAWKEWGVASVEDAQSAMQSLVDHLVGPGKMKLSIAKEGVVDENGKSVAAKYTPAAAGKMAEAIISAFAPDGSAHTVHETWHHIHDMLKGMGEHGEYILNNLMKATERPMMDAALKKALENDPDALAQLSEPKERLAYAFETFIKNNGKIPLDLESRSWFQKVVDWVRDLVGATSGEQRMQNFFKYITDQGLVRDGIENPYSTLQALGETKTDRFIHRTGEAIKPLKTIFKTVLSSATQRVKDHKIEEFDEIVKAYGGETGKGGMHSNHVSALNKLGVLLDNITKNATDEQIRDFRTYEPVMKALHEYREERAKAYKDATGKELSIEINHIIDRVASFDRENVSDNMQAFMIDLVRYGGLKGDKATEAKDIATKIADRGFYYNPDRVLFPDRPDIKNKWAEKNTERAVANLIIKATREIEREVSFGKRTKEAPQGERIKELLDSAIAKGASPEALKDIKNYMDGFDGTHDVKLSPEMKELVGGILFANNVHQLPFAVFSQLLEPMQLAMRKNSFDGLFSATWRGVKDMPRAFEKINKNYDIDYWEKLAREVGTAKSRVLGESLAQLSNGIDSRGITGKMNDWFFHWNMMDGWDRSIHIEATRHAVEFLIDHANGIDPKHSERFLRELGVTKEQVLAAVKTEMHKGEAYKTLDVTGAANRKVYEAVNQYVNEALAHPDAGSNPMWMNDPRFALIAQMKRFTFAFTRYVLDRNMRELQKNENYWMLAPMAASIPWMIMADNLKAVAKMGVGEHPNVSMIDTFMHGFERAGMAGKAQFATDALRSAEHGGSALSTLLGPTAEGIDKLFRGSFHATGGDAAAITNSGSIGADILPFATRLASL